MLCISDMIVNVLLCLLFIEKTKEDDEKTKMEKLENRPPPQKQEKMKEYEDENKQI